MAKYRHVQSVLDEFNILVFLKRCHVYRLTSIYFCERLCFLNNKKQIISRRS